MICKYENRLRFFKIKKTNLEKYGSENVFGSKEIKEKILETTKERYGVNHIMLLDEPTNHLDIETIDALIDSINIFDGAIVTITHNIELIEKTNTVLYEISDKSLNKIDFDDYYKKIVDEL